MIIRKKAQKLQPAKEEKKQELESDILPPITENASLIMKERAERRRGDRRRGYRRIDDRNLISRAHEESLIIKNEAKQEGFEQGISVAQEDIQKLRDAIELLMKAREDAFNKTIEETAFLAIKIAEKIIKTKVECDDTIILNIVTEISKEIDKAEKRVTVKINPDDIEKTRDFQSPFDIDFVPQSDIEQGSCMVETKAGLIDARFSTQLAIIKQAFEEGI